MAEKEEGLLEDGSDEFVGERTERERRREGELANTVGRLEKFHGGTVITVGCWVGDVGQWLDGGYGGRGGHGS
ncbi:unnamed protein product [Prunus armeniaca]